MSSDPAARAGALLEIDLGAIVANWRLLAEHAAPALCAAVVKANADGVGAAPVAAAPATAGGPAVSVGAPSVIFLGAVYCFVFVRPGAALYAVNPQPGDPHPMRQVVRLSGKILQV